MEFHRVTMVTALCRVPEAGAAARSGAGLELEGCQAEEDGGHSRRPARPDRAAQGVCCGQSQVHTLPDCHLVILTRGGGGGGRVWAYWGVEGW